MLANIIEILVLGIAIAFLMSWGYVKKQRQSEEIVNQLTYKCEKKVRKEFKKGEIMSWTELSETIKGTKSSLFWSKKKAILHDPSEILDKILLNMINSGEIVEGKQKTYKWVKGGSL